MHTYLKSFFKFGLGLNTRKMQVLGWVQVGLIKKKTKFYFLVTLDFRIERFYVFCEPWFYTL